MNKRVLVSFDDVCPYQCKHCYTLDIYRSEHNRSISEIVNSIKAKNFDVVYVSQRRDNFTNPDKGITLCEQIFKEYKTNILVITRNIFNEKQIDRLLKLKKEMDKDKKQIVIANSFFATKSYVKSENPNKVPSPYERLNFLQQLSYSGVKTIAIIRPVFPMTIVPISELYELIDACKEIGACVVSSGLAVNDNICWRLGLEPSKMNYLENVHYLEGVMEGELNFIDVSEEINKLEKYCNKQGVAFFEHTMQALNYITNK